MPFTYSRTVHFPDTDAAGVVYFANFLSICHEAYEESLQAAGIGLKEFFAETGVVIPVSRSEADYLRPLVCGDRLHVTVAPTLISANSFSIRYEIIRLGGGDKVAARVRTEHVCTSRPQRERVPVPPALLAWIKAG